MPDPRISPDFLKEAFRPEDRIALVLIDRAGPDRPHVETRILTVGKAVGEPYQAWLRHKNAERFDIYVGLNPVHAGATGRTKSDIAEVRPLYLDFDDGRGSVPLDALLANSDIPKPHIIVNTSPGNHQVIWRASGFEKPQAEQLLRGLSRNAGADIAATDVSRVLRLPGFSNWKREQPHYVTVIDRPNRAAAVHPQDFPAVIFDRGRDIASTALPHDPPHSSGNNSRSERDWRNVLHRLERGESPEVIARDLAKQRSDKPNPGYYAQHTVERAVNVHKTKEAVKTISNPFNPVPDDRRGR